MTNSSRHRLDTERDTVISKLEILYGQYNFYGIGDDDFPFSKTAINLRERISGLQDEKRRLDHALVRN